MPRTFLICSKTRWRSALSFGARNTKAPSLVRSSITFFTAALTSSSVKFVVGPLTVGAVPSPDAAGAGFTVGAFVGGRTAVVNGAAAARRNATPIALAYAIEARPRSKPSYIIGSSFLVIPGADAPSRCQGTRYWDGRRSATLRPQTAVGWGGSTCKLP